MSVRSALGATAESGALHLTGTALDAREAALRGHTVQRASARARVGQLGLVGVLASGLVLCVAGPNTNALLPEAVRPIPAQWAGPFYGSGVGLGVVALLALLVAMFVSYVAAANFADRLTARAVLMAIAALHAIVLLAPPLFSTDVFSYQAYARMGAVYGANPYLHGPYAIAFDQLYPLIGSKWVATPTAYGPVFTAFSYLLAPLSIPSSVVAYKALAAVSSLGLVAFVWNAARLRGLDPVKAAALVGLNPLLVLYGVGGGHNDLLMLAAIAAGIYLILSQRPRTAGGSHAVAAGIKLTAGLFSAFALAGAAARAGSRSRGRDVLLGALVAGAFVVGLGFVMFGNGPLHIVATIVNGQRKGDWHSIPGFISTRLGLATAGHVTGIALASAFALTSAWLLLRVWRGRLDWIDGAGWATAVLLVTASAVLPWYVAWLLPFAALASDRRLWRAAIVLTGIVQLIALLGYVPTFGL